VRQGADDAFLADRTEFGVDRQGKRLGRSPFRFRELALLVAQVLEALLDVKRLGIINRAADLLGLERTTLTRSATLLEREGWIGAEPSQDRRERPLRLTEPGRQKLEAAYPSWKAAQDSLNQTQS